LKAEEEEKLQRNTRLATTAILRMTYSSVEDHFMEMMNDAFHILADGADARRKARQSIIMLQRHWRRKLTLRAAREYRMSKLSHLYNIQADVGGKEECLKIQAQIRGILTRIRLRRGKDLIMQSDFLVGAKKTLTRGRCAIELYLECYADFLKSHGDNQSYSRIGSNLFVSELLAFREKWNHERAHKKARVFGTAADEASDPSIARPQAPMAHPQPILQPDGPSSAYSQVPEL
jgi:hypothetical protein